MVSDMQESFSVTVLFLLSYTGDKDKEVHFHPKNEAKILNTAIPTADEI